MRKPDKSDVIVIRGDMAFFLCPYCKNLHSIKMEISNEVIDEHSLSFQAAIVRESRLDTHCLRIHIPKVKAGIQLDYSVSLKNWIYRYPYFAYSLHFDSISKDGQKNHCHLFMWHGGLRLLTGDSILNGVRVCLMENKPGYLLGDRSGQTSEIPMIPYKNWGKFKVFG
jgi:hypothetical protein